MATYNSIKEASDAYFAAKAKGDAAGMKAANDAANSIRQSQGQKPQYATSDIASVANRNNPTTATATKSTAGTPTIQPAGNNRGSSTTQTASGGNVSVTLPNGQTTGAATSGGKVTSNLPVGTIVHTAGGDYRITGGTAGNYTSERYTGASSGGSSGSSGGSAGNVAVTLPNGQKTSAAYTNGKVSSNLPIGSIIHTAGGDFQITGGTPGNYTSERYTGASVPAQNVDYSDLINQAIDRGASWEDVQDLLDKRNAKIGTDPNLSKYLYDENYNRAMQYIYTKQQNEAQLQANLASLEGAYRSSLAGYDSARNQIEPTYQAQRNQAAASSDVKWGGFNEVAAANGLNTGAVGQAALSRAVTLQNNMNDLNRSEAEELSKIDLEVAQLTAEYNSAIAKAKANGDADLAAALYQQFNDYIDRKQTERANAIALQQAQQDAQASAQQDAYDVALKLITKGIMPTDTQLAAAGMSRADAEALYYQVIQQKATKSSSNSGGSGRGSSSGSSGSGSYTGNGNLSTGQVKELQKYLGVSADGKWGNNSSSAAGGLTADDAWKAYQDGTLLQGGKVNLANLQKALNISADGKWGPQTESALKDYSTVIKAMKQAGLSTADMMTPEEFARHNNRSGSVTFNSYKDYIKAYVYDMVNV